MAHKDLISMTGTIDRNKLSYLLIGNGKLAKHLLYYFQSQNIFIKSWSRSENTPEELLSHFEKTHITLLAISDSSLETFIEEHSFLKTKPIIHFSGATEISGTTSIHPLMSFGNDLYAIDFYKRIPFITFSSTNDASSGMAFSDAFPNLTNPHHTIEAKNKSLYHSLCVLSNNFTTLLWNKTFSTFEQKLQLPPEVLYPYLEKTFDNLKKNYKTALTGPLARKDFSTVTKNIEALNDDEYQKIYRTFVEVEFQEYLTSNKEQKNENHT